MASFDNQKLAASIYYLVQSLNGQLTRTKLVKLLFLADRIAKLERNATISGIKYIYYLYGPYNEAIPEYLREMNGNEIIEAPKEFAVHSGYSYILGDSPRINPLDILSEDDVKILNKVIAEQGFKPLSDVLDYVYNLDCMKKAQPLSTVLE